MTGECRDVYCSHYLWCRRRFDENYSDCKEALLLEKLEWDAEQEKAYEAEMERDFSEPEDEDE